MGWVVKLALLFKVIDRHWKHWRISVCVIHCYDDIESDSVCSLIAVLQAVVL